MTQPAVTVPAGPTSCARRRLAREGSAYPARRGVHTLHTVSLFRPSPKVAMNLLIAEDHKMREKKAVSITTLFETTPFSHNTSGLHCGGWVIDSKSTPHGYNACNISR